MKQFNSNTFVCFLDISGFKKVLKSDIHKASIMLDTFYSAGYQTLKSHPTLNGIFVSDCGIIFPYKGTPTDRFIEILKAVKNINKKMLEYNFLTTASIAYGHLEYKKKFVFDRIQKNAIMGNGYLNAFIDNEDSTNKILPGQVRVTKKIEESYLQKNIFQKIDFSKSFLNSLEENCSHYYFHWFLNQQLSNNKIKANNAFTKFTTNNNPDKYDILISDLKKLD